MKKFTYIITFLLVCGAFARAGAQNIVKDSLEFDKADAASAALLLRGKLSGVQVSGTDGSLNGAVSTRIRGVNSLRGDSQPLWIVDGAVINSSLDRNTDAFFQYGESSYTTPLNALASINLFDIESIEVLKDLSSTSIYGSRGANGVIIIKTKLSKVAGARVNWRSNMDFSLNEMNLPECRNAVSHNHHVNVSGSTKRALYSLSAFFRQMEGTLKGNDQMFGGIRANFDIKANSAVWFGMNASVTLGRTDNPGSTAFYGHPAGWMDDYDDQTQDRRFTNSMYVQLNFTPALSLKASLGLDFQNNNRYVWYGNGTSFGLENNGAASVLGTSEFNYNADVVLKWERIFAQKHKVTLKGAGEANGNWMKNNVMNGTDFLTHVLRARGLSLAGSKSIIHKYDHDCFTYGGYANAAYSFADIVGMDAIMHLDVTPRYDSKPVIYKSADVWFNVADAFFKDSRSVSTLRIKAGYGEAGRERYVPYYLFPAVLTGSYPEIESQYQMFFEGFNRLNSAEFNAGIDLGFAGDRLLLHAGYYDKITSDKFNGYIFGEPDDEGHYWQYTALDDLFVRNSIIANRGIELDLKADILRGPVDWSVYGNLSYNVNQMLKVDGQDGDGKALGKGIVAGANVTGKPVGSFVGYDDSYSTEFVSLLGNPNPKTYGGFGTTLKYRGFTVDIAFDGAAGFNILNMNRMFSDMADKVSDKYIEKGDFLRLNRATISYDFNVSKVKWLRGIQLNLTANNILTVTDYTGRTPDVNSFGISGLSNGVDYGVCPTARSFVAGINVNF